MDAWLSLPVQAVGPAGQSPLRLATEGAVLEVGYSASTEKAKMVVSEIERAAPNLIRASLRCDNESCVKNSLRLTKRDAII